ncbi:MAG: ArsR family transcriptional regulator [Clostridiales bacterium]|nr:ArsR family transcriptional regulator [Clostridiales bacterium]
MVQIWGVGSQGLLSKLSIFKVLADETRLKILLQMNQGPKYLTEMADSLGFSTPAIKYHLE